MPVIGIVTRTLLSLPVASLFQDSPRPGTGVGPGCDSVNAVLRPGPGTGPGLSQVPSRARPALAGGPALAVASDIMKFIDQVA
jgi:hypothetical protein